MKSELALNQLFNNDFNCPCNNGLSEDCCQTKAAMCQRRGPSPDTASDCALSKNDDDIVCWQAARC